MLDRVHIIWDNSNIFISGQSVCDKLERKAYEFRMDFEALIDLAADGRRIEQVFCVGSVPPPTNSVWGHIEKKTGKKPETYERGAASGKEQAIDQALQTRMLRLGYDFTPAETIVLLSGDGSGFEEGTGFFADVRRLHKIGWKIEILSWRDHCKREMRIWAEANGLFVPLDDFYSSVTFLEKLRRARPLDLGKRPRLPAETVSS
ncbi:NYN domain-containing protein [Rhizobium leguminosarum]|uniref:NYN domain-containing protein n=1 Tax=Rhizobium leguminosarum TaxID=384 RepID=UPI0013EF436C|nr:NYN domain-containing protein [Rhizobium leguminosarum]